MNRRIGSVAVLFCVLAGLWVAEVRAEEVSQFLGGDVMTSGNWTEGLPGSGTDGRVEEDGTFTAAGTLAWFGGATVTIDGGLLTREDGNVMLSLSANGYLRIHSGGLSTEGGFGLNRAGFEINGGSLTANFIYFYGTGEGASLGRGTVNGGSVTVNELRMFNAQDAKKEFYVSGGTVTINNQLRFTGSAGPDGFVTVAGGGHIIINGSTPFDAWGDGYINFLPDPLARASLTVADFSESDFEALYDANRLRFDGGNEGDFSDHFVVTGNTLSLYSDPSNIIDLARVHFPFEGIDEGRRSTAWVNHGFTGSGETASRIGPAPNPIITTRAEGLKGQAYNGSVDALAGALMWGEFGAASPTPIESATDEITSFTITAWLKSEPGVRLHNQRIVTTPNFELNYLSSTDGSEGRLSARVGHGGDWYSGSTISGFGIMGEWQFIAVVWDGTSNPGSLRFYYGGTNTPVALDVAVPTEIAGTLTNDSHGGNIWLGATSTTTANASTFRGLMDEFRIFSNDDGPEGALTQAQLEQIRQHDLIPLEPAGYRTIAIVNPYDGLDWSTLEHHTANLHTHTRYSDGLLDPHQVIDMYYTNGYTILALTDHDHHHYSVRPATLFPWTEISNIYEEIKHEISPVWGESWEDASSEPWQSRDPDVMGMVAIEGVEVSLTHHIGSYFNDYAERPEDELTALQEIHNRGGLSVFFHPLREGGKEDQPYDWYVDWYQQFDSLVGLEVASFGDGWAQQRELWDQILHELMPERPVWGFANDDMHNEGQFGRNRSVFLLDSLSSANVRAAMEDGHTYFYRTDEARYGLNTLVLEDVVVDSEQIALTVPEYNVIYWSTYDPVREVSEIIYHGPVLPFEAVPEYAVFVRAHIVGDVARMWTQPFGVIDASETGQTYTEWIAAMNIPEGQQGIADDPYGTGTANLVAYATGLPPDEPGQQPLDISVEGGEPVIAVPWRTDISAEAYFEVERSTNLIDWVVETNLLWNAVPLDASRDRLLGYPFIGELETRLFYRLFFGLHE
jgi:hypothetical protein